MHRVLILAAVVAAAAGQGQVCPDGKRCSDGSCCMTMRPDELYGCCPFLNGVCCPDMLHCCPQNYHCDLDEGMCLPGPDRLRWLQRLRLLPRRRSRGGRHPVPLALSSTAAPAAASAPVRDDKCPDGKTSCSAAATCCPLSSGDYACCPEPNAVCCPDHIHCCPEGTKCDVKDRTCLKVKKHPILTLV